MEVTDGFKMTQIPLLDKFLYKNWLADTIRRAPGLKILQFVDPAIQERRELRAKGGAKVADKYGGKPDFLERYIEIQEESKELPPWYTNVPGMYNETAN